MRMRIQGISAKRLCLSYARFQDFGAHLSRRQLGDQIEFLVLTRWQSMDVIRGFAGADTEKAVWNRVPLRHWSSLTGLFTTTS